MKVQVLIEAESAIKFETRSYKKHSLLIEIMKSRNWTFIVSGLNKSRSVDL
jgi:hypothetical protein